MVLSPGTYNKKVGLCILCPVTSQVKGYPFEVVLPPGHPVTGAILADQVKSVSWERRATRFAGRAPAAVVAEARAKIRALLKL